MKRDIIVSQLIKEGFSEKTLVRFSDKQLNNLAERMLTEQEVGGYKEGPGEKLTPELKHYNTIVKPQLSKAGFKDSYDKVMEPYGTENSMVYGNHNTGVNVVWDRKKGVYYVYVANNKGLKTFSLGPNDPKLVANNVVKYALSLKGNATAVTQVSETDVMISKKDPLANQKIEDAKKQNKSIETYEEDMKEDLKGKQKNIDKNHNGEIDAEDFAILNKEKKGEAKEDVNEADMGLTVKGSKSSSSSVFGGIPKKSSSPKKKSTPKKKEEDETDEGKDSLHDIIHGAIKDKLKGDLGREPEQHEVEEEHQKYIDGCKTEGDEPKKEDGDKKFPFKKKKEEDVEEGDYHNERSDKALEKSKEDFPQLKNLKKCDECGKVESKCKCKKEDIKEVKNWVKGLVENKEFHSFTSKNEIMELIQSKLTESNTMVQHGPKVKKGHNGIPEFMSYDAIVSAEPKTAPSKPAPQTKPGTRPTPTRREDPRKTPFQPGPGPNPKPKAKIAEEKKVK